MNDEVPLPTLAEHPRSVPRPLSSKDVTWQPWRSRGCLPLLSPKHFPAPSLSGLASRECPHPSLHSGRGAQLTSAASLHTGLGAAPLFSTLGLQLPLPGQHHSPYLPEPGSRAPPAPRCSSAGPLPPLASWIFFVMSPGPVLGSICVPRARVPPISVSPRLLRAGPKEI